MESLSEGTAVNRTVDILRQPSPENSSPVILPSEKNFSSPLHNHDTQTSCAEITPVFRRVCYKRNAVGSHIDEPLLSKRHINRFDSLAAHYFAFDSMPSSQDELLPSLILGIDDGVTELNKSLNSLSKLIEECTTKYRNINTDVSTYMAWLMDIKELVEQRSVSWKERKRSVEDEMIACIDCSMKLKQSG